MPERDVRARLVDALQADLVGPFVPDDAGGGEQEILPVAPSRWYLTGFLAPEGGRVPDPVDDQSNGGEAAVGSELPNEDAGSTEPEANRPVWFAEPALRRVAKSLPRATLPAWPPPTWPQSSTSCAPSRPEKSLASSPSSSMTSRDRRTRAGPWRGVRSSTGAGTTRRNAPAPPETRSSRGHVGRWFGREAPHRPPQRRAGSSSRWPTSRRGGADARTGGQAPNPRSLPLVTPRRPGCEARGSAPPLIERCRASWERRRRSKPLTLHCEQSRHSSLPWANRPRR